MLKFEYDTSDIEYGENNKVIMEWEGEDGDIHEILERFKYFLLGMSYPDSLVNKIVYLDDSQAAKLKLLDEDYE